MTTPLLEAIVEGLTPEERQELVDACDYMSEHAQAGSTPPEGGFARIINQLSPNVRQRFASLVELLETPRAAPYQPKLSQSDYAEALGADPQLLTGVKQSLDDDHIAGQLQRRMGTDASLAYGQPEQPLSLKEQLQAALELHQGSK